MEDILCTYCISIHSAVIHKLNASGPMLIWTSFLALVCGICAQACPHLELELGVLLAADSQAISSSGYRASLSDP
jgi:hypothetical protein